MYTAIVLDKESHELLKSVIGDYSDDWEILCHHTTVNLGTIDCGPMHNVKVGSMFKIETTHIGDIKDKITAVKIRIDDSLFATINEIPHISVAVNRKNGGKPFHSNKISNWVMCNTYHLTGYLEECN
jgi:hypothetical protein